MLLKIPTAMRWIREFVILLPLLTVCRPLSLKKCLTFVLFVYHCNGTGSSLLPSCYVVTETAIIFANYATKSYRTSTCIVMVAKAYSIRITTSASVAMETAVTRSLLRCILSRKRKIVPSTTRVTMEGTFEETSALAGKARPARAAASARAARAGVTSVSRCTCASPLWMKCLL